MLGRKTLTHHSHVSEYTGELFGAEYLYSQTGYALSPKGEELDKEIDEGFDDMSEEDSSDSPSPTLTASEADMTIAPPDDPDSDGDTGQEEEREEEKV